MSTNIDYSRMYAIVFDLANDTREILEKLRTCVKDGNLIALPTANNTKDTRPSGFSNDRLYVLKTYPTLGSNQDHISMTDDQRNAILIQNLNSAQNRINKMKNNARDDYCHILVAGDTNSGKSVFINGLLRRDILPSGGRALTSVFVEVFDAQDIGGKEEAHLYRKGRNYDCKNERTFRRESIDNLYNIMYDWYSKQYDTIYDGIKVYVDHRHANANFFNCSGYKVHITDSIGRNIDDDKISSLLKKQEEIDVLIFTIDARYGLTESSIKILEYYCKEKTPIFTVITHLDCVCCCRDECCRTCKEDCKQEIIDAIEEALSVEFGSTNELTHCVNPTLVPLWDDDSDYTRREIPLEWTEMENCLHTFIYDKFHFYKLSPIKHYLQMLLHDVILFSRLNATMIMSKINETTKKIHQLQNSINQLKDKHGKTYVKAKSKIDATINDIRYYILRQMNDLKGDPEKLVSRKMISRIDSNITEAEVYILLQERWKEFEEECNQKVNEYIQNCANYIDQLVKGLPKGSIYDEKTNILAYQRQLSRQQTPFDNVSNHSYALTRSKGGLAGIGRYAASAVIACGTSEIGLPLVVISIAGIVVGKIVEALWDYVKRQFKGKSVDRLHEKAKNIVRETLSGKNFAENYATRAIEAAERHLLPLLSSKISNSHIAAITEQTNQLCACNEEKGKLEERKLFFQQLNEKAIQIYNSVRNLQL